MSWLKVVLLLKLVNDNIAFELSQPLTVQSQFYQENHHIKQLNGTMFNTTIQSITPKDIYFIEFFSHWCHVCKDFKGEYINFANYISKYYNNNINGYNIKLFGIDLEAKWDKTIKGLHNRYNITGYPTLLLFIGSAKNYIIYNGGQNKYELHKFLEKILNKYNIIDSNSELISFPDEYCLNTQSGNNPKEEITDSKGWICPINRINSATKCCESINKYDYYSICNKITKCNDYFPCCNKYNYCVACCLNKLNKLNPFFGEIMNQSFNTNDRKTFLEIENKYFNNFSFCANQCRTSSLSTFEGNVYVDYRDYYCYFQNITEYELPLKLLSYIDMNENNQNNNNYLIKVGNNGQSCNDVCNLNGKQCVDNVRRMSVINSCTSIKKYVKNCNGGCMFGYDDFLPAFKLGQSRCYLKASIAKHQSYSCDAKADTYQRLCLCK